MWTVLLLPLLAGALLAEEPAFRVLVDTGGAPHLAAHAERARVICEEWYPRINAKLYGEGHPYLYRDVRIVIEPGGPKAGKSGWVVAWAVNGTMHLPADWLQGDPPDFGTVVAHELTHIVTDNYAFKIARCDGFHAIPCFFKIHFYKPNRGVGWTEEAIADYVAFALFTQRLESRLRFNADGLLTGYDKSVPYLHGLQEYKIPLKKKGYQRSYSVGATFLVFLERAKNKDIVRLLNVALTQHRASPELIRKLAGRSVDALWKEFVEQ